MCVFALPLCATVAKLKFLRQSIETCLGSKGKRPYESLVLAVLVQNIFILCIFSGKIETNICVLRDRFCRYWSGGGDREHFILPYSMDSDYRDRKFPRQPPGGAVSHMQLSCCLTALPAPS